MYISWRRATEAATTSETSGTTPPTPTSFEGFANRTKA